MNDLKIKMDASSFLKIENIFLENDLDTCETIISNLLESKGVFLSKIRTEMSENPRILKQQQLEIKRPSLLSRQLRESAVFNHCKKIAADYFDGHAYYLFDHAIYKMPGSQTITPWHQDQAYLGSDIIIPSLHFWIPFQVTTIENGAMQFVEHKYSHLLPHVAAYTTNPHVLKVADKPTGNIYTMNINKGDVSIHDHLSLHSSTANKSTHIRKAWIIHFGQKPEWYKHWLKVRKYLFSSAPTKPSPDSNGTTE
ncbi:MAG TPA: phytanoyl-CoA dioxygenase family protein [Cellvibrio sp.]|nr:phytanoyl-CoA dioxygenase family protein [Cellvibrio sp.]